MKLEDLDEAIIQEAIDSSQASRRRSYRGRIGIKVQATIARQGESRTLRAPLGAGENAPLNVGFHRRKREEETHD